MTWKCEDCGNTEKFYGVGAVSVTVRFDKHGWATDVDDIDYGGHGAVVENCGVCDSENLKRIEEE